MVHLETIREHECWFGGCRVYGLCSVPGFIIGLGFRA